MNERDRTAEWTMNDRYATQRAKDLSRSWLGMARFDGTGLLDNVLLEKERWYRLGI